MIGDLERGFCVTFASLSFASPLREQGLNSFLIQAARLPLCLLGDAVRVGTDPSLWGTGGSLPHGTWAARLAERVCDHSRIGCAAMTRSVPRCPSPCPSTPLLSVGLALTLALLPAGAPGALWLLSRSWVLEQQGSVCLYLGQCCRLQPPLFCRERSENAFLQEVFGEAVSRRRGKHAVQGLRIYFEAAVPGCGVTPHC